MASTIETRLQARQRVLLVGDLAGYARLFRSHADEPIARFVHDYYSVVQRGLSAHGGQLIKFIGDAFLALFAEGAAPRAVACTIELERRVRLLAAQHGFGVVLGANLHAATVIEGDYGAPAPQHDVIGSGVNHAFLLGQGPGLRISEPVYRALPSGERSPWRKVKPPATYHFEPGSG